MYKWVCCYFVLLSGILLAMIAHIKQNVISECIFPVIKTTQFAKVKVAKAKYRKTTLQFKFYCIYMVKNYNCISIKLYFWNELDTQNRICQNTVHYIISLTEFMIHCLVQHSCSTINVSLMLQTFHGTYSKVPPTDPGQSHLSFHNLPHRSTAACVCLCALLQSWSTAGFAGGVIKFSMWG